MAGSHSFNGRGNYFEFGTAVTNQSPVKLTAEDKSTSGRGSFVPQKRRTETSESNKLHQNPLTSALFKSKTHMTGTDNNETESD